MYLASWLLPRTIISSAVSVPRTIGASAIASGGISDASEASSGLSLTNEPSSTNPPSWANRLLGGPLTR